MPQLWAGVDAGKTHHHCMVILSSVRRSGRRTGVNPARASPRLAAAFRRHRGALEGPGHVAAR
jgi:hypothetical protein